MTNVFLGTNFLKKNLYSYLCNFLASAGFAFALFFLILPQIQCLDKELLPTILKIEKLGEGTFLDSSCETSLMLM